MTKEQREALRSLSRVHRQVYNATVAYLRRRNRQIRARPPDDEEADDKEQNDEETDDEETDDEESDDEEIDDKESDDKESDDKETDDEETEEDGDEVEPETDEEQKDGDFFAVFNKFDLSCGFIFYRHLHKFYRIYIFDFATCSKFFIPFFSYRYIYISSK